MELLERVEKIEKQEEGKQRRAKFAREEREGIISYNGGQPCDMLDGPCSCGAGHSYFEWIVDGRRLTWTGKQKLSAVLSKKLR